LIDSEMRNAPRTFLFKAINYQFSTKTGHPVSRQKFP
jgi:hypothetical protein